jgi:hypothetical protein
MHMWLWLIGAYTTLLLVLIGCAGFVTLFVGDDNRRRQAFRVLRLLLATCTSVVVVTAFRLYQSGLLG